MSSIQQSWQTIVDQAIALGVAPSDIPSGVITASNEDDDELQFKSTYKG